MSPRSTQEDLLTSNVCMKSEPAYLYATCFSQDWIHMHQAAQLFLDMLLSNMITISSQSSTIILFSPSNQPLTDAVASSSALDRFLASGVHVLIYLSREKSARQKLPEPGIATTGRR